MAAIADVMHMSKVRRNKTSVKLAVMMIGKAVSAVIRTTAVSINKATEKPITALIRAWQMITL
jgi:hypothetical protein